MEHEIVVVGAGISGAVLAERFANELGKKVLVLEKRDHIGGNCYDYFNEAGVLVPKYGPHFFHTQYEEVWQYVGKFTEWHPYEHRVRAWVDGKSVPVPVNIETINIVFGLDLRTEQQAAEWFSKNVPVIPEPKNSEEAAIGRVGEVLYEKIFKNYTKKQWDRWPAELDASVTSRIPVRMNFDDRYFTDPYQAMPKAGYTELFKNMFSNPLIEVRLNTNYFDFPPPQCEKLFFTGPIDSFFADRGFGKLEYRSLKFEYETVNAEYYQECAQVNYPNEHAYTRITEPKHATGQQHPQTTIIREYPTWEGEPYYPVPNPANGEIYKKYQEAAKELEKEGVYFVGRLANYKYFNMDQAFKNALDLFHALEK